MDQFGGQFTISNTETIPGRQITEFYGIATGSTVRAKHIGKDIMAGLKNIVGGELKSYTELLSEARQEALQRMIAEAVRLMHAIPGVTGVESRIGHLGFAREPD